MFATPNPTMTAQPVAAGSGFGVVPPELMEMILEKAARPGNRRVSYLSYMHVCKAFMGE